ncbi:hypothetical protein [Clostridium botulinum]|uniref:hypothetical protein n=1 Tax=Clostridium botulinum TaxID=1491 RepID=UPI001C9B4AD1|nr:hypothetical protein [Clostridium botulinum]MBY6877972.1 hypothetical protein [Clostridium botulinum]
MVFTNMLYFYGIKYDWQKIRMSYKLIRNEKKNPPKFHSKYRIIKKTHFVNCFKLKFATYCLSMLIMFTFYYTNPIKNIENLVNFISVFLSLLFIYIILAGAPIENTDVFKDQKDKLFIKTIAAISFLKRKLIDSIVKNEFEEYQQYIVNTIKGLYENDEKLKQGALIMRINSEFFNDIFSNDIDVSLKEQLKDYAYKMLVLYYNKDITLLDQLQKLFKDSIFERNATMEDVISFIENLELTSKSLKQKDIDKYINRQINMKKEKTKEVKSLEEVNNIIFSSEIDTVNTKYECVANSSIKTLES